MIAVLMRGVESVFSWTLEVSWQAAVLATLVLLLQWALRGRLNPRWHHVLWLLVVARLILPVLPESSLSLFRFAPRPPPLVERTMTAPLFFTPSAPLVQPDIATLTDPSSPSQISAFTILSLIWVAGSAGLFVLTWWVNRRFARHVLTAPTVDDPCLLQLAEAARHELGLRRRLKIVISDHVSSPAIMGLVGPTLILPKDVRFRFNDDELRFIFLHEFAHLKRGDLVLQWLIALLQIAHWFNPVLWYAFRRMRLDREPATDALVLSHTGEEQKQSYGRVLLKLLQHYQSRHALPTLVGILEDKNQFKRRFSLIARFTHGAYGWSLLGVSLVAALALIGLTKAKADESAPHAAGNPVLRLGHFVEGARHGVATVPAAGLVPKRYATVSPPHARATVVQEHGQIEIGLIVMEISNDVYLANKNRVDSAVDESDTALLAKMQGVVVLSTLSVSTPPGTKAYIDVVREFAYPSEFRPGRVVPKRVASVQGKGTTDVILLVPPTPREFATKNIGLSAEITPTINPADSPSPGKILLNGKFSVTGFDGFTTTNVGGIPHGMPSFTTGESLFLEQLDDHREKGFWIPGEHLALQNPTAASYKPGWEKTALTVKKRYLLFVRASLIK